jgi:hypothetical protein
VTDENATEDVLNTFKGMSGCFDIDGLERWAGEKAKEDTTLGCFRDKFDFFSLLVYALV